MRKFNVTVNGKTYFVEVEEAASGVSSAPMNAPVSVPMNVASTQPPVAVQQPTPPVAAPQVVDGGDKGTPAKCPLPGLVISLAFKTGDMVKKGDKIMVLEAMKMEHDIVAAQDGVITYAVSKGDALESGVVIAFIK